MGIVVIPSFGADPVSVTGPTLDAKVDGLGTEFNGNIENTNIKSTAAIANSKLNLASIAQDVTLAGTNVLSGATTISGASTISGIMTMSSKILKLAKGADVASAAGAMTLGDDGNYFDITGTNAITSITAKTAGTIVALQFDSTATLTDGSNLKLDGNYQGATGSTILLASDGTNWFELSRSPSASAAAQAGQETATSTTTYVSPGTQQYHPSAAKAWCYFDGTGTPDMKGAYNIDDTITDGGAGIYTLTFTTDFSAATWCMVAGGQGVAGPIGCNVSIKDDFTLTAAAITIRTENNVNGAATDFPAIYMAFFGDQ